MSDDTIKCGFRYLKRRRRFSKTSTASLFIPLNSAWQFATIKYYLRGVANWWQILGHDHNKKNAPIIRYKKTIYVSLELTRIFHTGHMKSIHD